MSDALNLPRCVRLIDRAIDRLELDLDGLTVLTEAATGPFGLTASIAARAGARGVYALARGSRFSSADEARKSTLEIAEALGVAARIEVFESREDTRIGGVDVVTNLGFVRPLDAAMLARLGPTAAVSLMFETWEHRPEDLDLAACRGLGIPVLGTNESLPELDTMSYVGQLAVKMALECRVEVLHGRFVVLGDGPFARATLAALRAAGADPAGVSHWPAPDLDPLELAEADALIVAEHRHRELLIGPGAPLAADAIAAVNPGLVVIHLAGGVDRDSLRGAALRCHPEQFAPAGWMSATTADLGPRPLIELHSAGLRVGELLARARRRGLTREAAEESALRHPVCQAFAPPVDG